MSWVSSYGGLVSVALQAQAVPNPEAEHTPIPFNGITPHL